jgi:DNA-binding NtrC family response regulator
VIRVLLVDDEAREHRIVEMILEDGHTVLSAYTGAQGVAMARAEGPDVVLLDIRLPDRNGLEVLKDILEIPVPPPVVIYTAYGDIPIAVQAIKAGAYDFVEKKGKLAPLTETIRRAAVARAGACSPAVEHGSEAVAAILGASPAIERVRTLVARFGGSSHPVMIRGESGTGKELVAAALHAVSGRKGPFLAVNCGALPDTLVESELFGTERGAFTDAPSRPGLFEQADRGSLFLDEVGEMSQPSQAKLLRVLEDKRVTRLGGEGARSVDVRVIAASCRDVGPAAGLLRRDLFYRLSVLSVEVPPLRERPDDVAILAAAFLRRDGGRPKRLSEAALERLRRHAWPGNVRELRNVIARATVLSDGDAVGAEGIVFD